MRSDTLWIVASTAACALAFLALLHVADRAFFAAIRELLAVALGLALMGVGFGVCFCADRFRGQWPWPVGVSLILFGVSIMSLTVENACERSADWAVLITEKCD